MKNFKDDVIVTLETVKAFNNISATEAREITQSSTLLENRAYKLIKEAAKEGCKGTVFCFPPLVDEGVAKSIITSLKNKGYEVSEFRDIEDNNSLVSIDIHW